VPYLSASAVVIHYEEALYQVYGPLPFIFEDINKELIIIKNNKLCAWRHNISCPSPTPAGAEEPHAAEPTET